MANPWLGIGLVLGILAALFGVLRAFQRLVAPNPEVVRKLMHVGMGLATLSFPWLFADVWPVVLLGGVSIGALAAVRLVRRLKSGLGSVLGGVARESFGEFYFVVSVGCLFCLARGQPFGPILYCIPLLILTLADACAALVGVRYGQRHYATLDGRKSAEGSIAFFLVACSSVHVPLLLGTEVGRAETLLIALALGLFVMMCEAVAWHGLDNVLVPLASYLLLRSYLGPPPMDAQQLGIRVCILCGLMILAWAWRRQTTLVGSGPFAAAIVGYLCWALGGWEWLLPPVTVFLTYAFPARRGEGDRQPAHNVDGVIASAAAALVWLFFARVFARREFYYPFVVAYAAQLAILALSPIRRAYPGIGTARLLVASVLKGCLLIFVPFALIDWQGGITGSTVKFVATGVVAVSLAVIVFFFTQPGPDGHPTDVARWLRQGIHSAIASVLGYASLYVL
jgi:phytol kinase